MDTNKEKKHPAARLWARMSPWAKAIAATPLAMALLGAEVSLRLSPKLDVVLTGIFIWMLWRWIGN